MRKLFKPMIVAVAAVLFAGAAYAEPPGMTDKDMAEMRGAVRQLMKEMEKDAAATREVTKELLREAQQNKKVMKEMMREVSKNKEAVKGMVESLLNDEELRNELKGMRSMLEELAAEMGEAQKGK
jgi:hypothetical protein